MSLTQLGISKLWRDDPEVAWRFMRWWMPFLTRRLAPSHGYGIERVPPRGGGVVAANHFTGIDPPLIGIYSRRTIYYMTKIELLSMPIAGEILRWTGAFAVRRGKGDRDAIRVARWLVQEGHLVGMFMEGTRQQFGYPGPVHSGAVMIALHEEVPVIPCGLDTFGWSTKNRRQCALVWGEPIRLDGLPRSGRGYKEGAAMLEAEIHRLWRQAAEAVAEGFPEQLADGTSRSAPVRHGRGLPIEGAQPWPDEPWAAGPLGPLYAARH